jgi:hypothetical protein
MRTELVSDVQSSSTGARSSSAPLGGEGRPAIAGDFPRPEGKRIVRMRFSRTAGIAGSTDAAPDYAEPIVGWRVWGVVEALGAPLLRSIFYPSIWPRLRSLHAGCERRSLLAPLRRGRQTHAAPLARCDCGIYACELELAAHYLTEPLSLGGGPIQRVAGQVALWGRVVECERGWRGEEAYPAAIFVSTCPLGRAKSRRAPRQLASQLWGYGVPVQLVEAEEPDEFVQALAQEPLISIGGD